MRGWTLNPSTRQSLIRVCMGVAWFSLAACSDASRTVSQDILRRTIPPGAAAPFLSEPVRSGRALRFEWDCETRMSPTTYADWLKTQLREFQVVDEDSSNLHLATLVGGDVYRLHITIMAGTSSHVHAQLTASAG